MSKAAPAPLKTSGPQFKSAWSNGPPRDTSASSTPRSQSPAPTSPAVTSHSRRPSTLGGASHNARTSRGSIVGKQDLPPQASASTVKEQGPPPASAPSQNQQSQQAKNEARSFSFGTITDKLPTTTSTASSNGKPAPPSSTTSAVSISAAASSSTSSPAPTSQSASPAPTAKPKLDVKSLFRANNADSAPSPGPSSFAETVASPSMRPNNLPVPGHAQSPYPGPNQHPSGPQGHAPQHMYGQPPQQQPFRPGSAAPRSPSFTRQMPNGTPGGRPHVQGGPPTSGPAVMSSPRMGAATAHPPHPQHQPPQQGQPPQMQVPQHTGQPMPQMPPQHMPPYGAWNSYYYPQPHYVPGMPMGQEYPYWMPQMQPPQTPHGAPAQLGHAPGQPHPPHGVPVSPRQPPQALHQHQPPIPPQQGPPGTPPAGVASPLPQQTRLNSGASAFVPGGRSKIKITDASGHTVDFTRRDGGNASGSGGAASSGTPSPVPFQRSQRTPVRMETEEARKKREEEARLKREAEERKVKEEKERVEQEERKKVEEEERLRREEEERKRKVEEEERIKKEEEERLKREMEEKVKREEEERIKKEEEERARQEEEKRREEEERQRRVEEEHKKQEEERLRKEEEERKEREAAEAAAKAKAEEEERERVAKAAAEAKAKSDKEQAEKNEAAKATELAATAAAAAAAAPISSSPESHKKRPVPGPLDLKAAQRSNISQPLPSALATARHITDLGAVQYPSGIMSPKPGLNEGAKDGKFRYDREFLLQFMNLCKDKPDNMPRLDALGLEAVEPTSHSMGRTGSGRRGVSGSMGPPSASASRQASIGLGISSGQPFGNKTVPGFAMGQFSTPKLTSEERYMRSTSLSMGASNAGAQFATNRTNQMVRSSSQGGPGGMQGNKRTRSSRGKARGEQSQFAPGQQGGGGGYSNAQAQPLEPVAPLQLSENRWVAGSTSRRPQQQDQNSPEYVDRKVRALLNKLTMEKFDSISDQIIEWANKSVNEKDGRTLIQVIRLVFEKATDEANWSEMYARLCRKMMEQISPNVQDDGIKNGDGKPITGGQLFRKYLLNRCQEDFERGWSQKEAATAAAASKAAEDNAKMEANEKSKAASGEEVLYSEEYYVAQKAKRQGLGLVKFIGELFKLQMLTERIMHECIKKLLSNVDNPEEEEIESLCKLLTTVGQSLDSSKAKGHMDIYFSRMKELAKSGNVTSRMQFMLLDVIELRERKWVTRNLSSAPKTIAQIHEEAAKEKAQAEKDSLNRTINMSRGGSRRGTDRGAGDQTNADGWSTAGSGPTRQQTKVGDLSNFGKISKSGSTQMSFAPTSVFSRGSKRDSTPLARTSSSSNMFSALSQGADAAAEPPAAVPSAKQSRPPSRLASMDMSQSQSGDSTPAGHRPRLNLLPRTKPMPAQESKSEEPSASEPVSEDEKEQEPSMSETDALKKIGNDVKEFFAIRNLDEAEDYFTKLPSAHRHLLVEKLVTFAIESKEADAKLVGDIFAQASEKNLCSASAFEEGFIPVAELLDDIAIDAPKAFDLMAIMLRGAKLGDESKNKIAGKSMDSDKLLALLA